MKKRILSISFIICIVVFTMFYVMQINMYYMNKIKSKNTINTITEETKEIYYDQTIKFIQYNLLKCINKSIQESHDTHINYKAYIQEINSQNQELNPTYENNSDVMQLIEFQPDKEESIINEKNGSSFVGVYSITAYTWTGNTMANGEYPYVGCVASCDFPLGTTIYIDGMGTFVVNDVCPTSGVIDVYMNTYDECINFGRFQANVSIVY